MQQDSGEASGSAVVGKKAIDGEASADWCSGGLLDAAT
jgi:hypothetical protein